MTGTRARERSFRGAAAVELRSGRLAAVFTPGLGMNGVSLRLDGAEHLALPGGLDAIRGGHTTGLPLLAPWANRLSALRYRVGRHHVDLTRRGLHADGSGLPIHGFLVGWTGWHVDALTARGDRARLAASTVVDAPAFPFPHRIELGVTATDGALHVDTTIVPTGRRAVPASIGWHPYLRLPGSPRRRWRLVLPARTHLALDDRGIPTGTGTPERAEAEPIGTRTFDDGYRLGRGRVLTIVDPDTDRRVELHAGRAYEHAQVWVPPGKPFVALEPMVAATNALVEGTAPLVRPGDALRARFSLVLAPSR